MTLFFSFVNATRLHLQIYFFILFLMLDTNEKITFGNENTNATELHVSMTPEEILDAKNIRKTPLRKQMLLFFLEKKQPLSVPDMLQYFRKMGFSVSKTSVYRQIARFEEKKIVHSAFLQKGEQFFEIMGAHHHHFVCDRCESVECFADKNLEIALFDAQNSLSARGIQASGHQISFSGLCRSCFLSSLSLLT